MSLLTILRAPKWAVGVLEGMSSIEMSKRLAQNFPSVSDRANFNQFAASGFYHELVNLHSDHVLGESERVFLCSLRPNELRHPESERKATGKCVAGSSFVSSVDLVSALWLVGANSLYFLGASIT